MRPIKHQKQPTDKTCTSTCLAMILDKPVQEIVEDFHQDYLEYNFMPSQYLEACGVKVKKFYSEGNLIRAEKLYLVTVPSINTQAGLHHILVDTRDIKNPKVYDPQEGTGNKFYVFYKTDDNPDSVELKGFVIDLEILDD